MAAQSPDLKYQLHDDSKMENKQSVINIATPLTESKKS